MVVNFTEDQFPGDGNVEGNVQLCGNKMSRFVHDALARQQEIRDAAVRGNVRIGEVRRCGNPVPARLKFQGRAAFRIRMDRVGEGHFLVLDRHAHGGKVDFAARFQQELHAERRRPVRFRLVGERALQAAGRTDQGRCKQDNMQERAFHRMVNLTSAPK